MRFTDYSEHKLIYFKYWRQKIKEGLHLGANLTQLRKIIKADKHGQVICASF